MNVESHNRNPMYYRDSVAGYVHYKADGSIAPLVVDAEGVGTYHGTGRIEAENFMEAGGPAEKVDLGGGSFDVALSDGATLRFPHVRALPRTATLRLRVRRMGREPEPSEAPPVLHVTARPSTPRPGAHEERAPTQRLTDCALRFETVAGATFEDATFGMQVPPGLWPAAAQGAAELDLELSLSAPPRSGVVLDSFLVTEPAASTATPAAPQ